MASLASMSAMATLTAQEPAAPPDTLEAARARPSLLYSPAVMDSIEASLQSSPRADLLPRKSPALALGLSAVLPGAGQAYTGRYLRIPVIWGFGYWFSRNWIKANDFYEEYREQFRLSVERGESGGAGNAQFKYIRDFYRDERDRFALYILITYLLNLMDAYVGASLYNFDVGEDLNGTAAVRMKISVPLR
ncbi:MAG: DUF5683 domain-containing protein [Bacteroidota bacterium]